MSPLDLSFTRFDADAEPVAMPHDLAVLMVGIAARQAASPTAAAQAEVARGAPDPRLFAPLDGAFNGATADAIARWCEEGLPKEEGPDGEGGQQGEARRAEE